MAFSTISSTSARLEQERAKRPSVCRAVSQISRFVKVLKNGSLKSMTNASGLMTMQAALSSVNFGLNSNPSFEKNAFDFFRSLTARLTKIIRELFEPISLLLLPVASWLPGPGPSLLDTFPTLPKLVHLPRQVRRVVARAHIV